MMKYLSHYIEEAQTELFDKTGTFFAFSRQQFEEHCQEGVEYANLGAGMICPVDNVDTLLEGLKSIRKAGIAQDVAENGLDAIIRRELYNHECIYTGDWTNAMMGLDGYNVSEEDILRVYREERKNAEKDI